MSVCVCGKLNKNKRGLTLKFNSPCPSYKTFYDSFKGWQIFVEHQLVMKNSVCLISYSVVGGIGYVCSDNRKSFFFLYFFKLTKLFLIFGYLYKKLKENNKSRVSNFKSHIILYSIPCTLSLIVNHHHDYMILKICLTE